jgi:phosphatidylethanolamine-binding protein (PEBP) family uncharacterized protein
MAQRTGDKRLLVSFVKAASARQTLALAAATLALAGCGGGSSVSGTDTGSSTAGSSIAAEPAEHDRRQTGGSPAASGHGEEAQGQGATPKAATENTPGASAAQGKKQGDPFQPKGPREGAPTPAQVESATVADIGLTSPAIQAAAGQPGQLAAAYTCDGANSWPELRVSGVPAGSAELILYAMSLQPVEGRLFVDWAVAGLDPGLEAIEAGKLPKGAVVGANSYGKRDYQVCPAAGAGEIYVFALYALPRRLGLAPGFDAREARKEILDTSGNVGLLPATYARG